MVPGSTIGCAITDETSVPVIGEGEYGYQRLHFRDAGPAAGGLPLDAFVGAAIVIDVRGREPLDADVLDGVDLVETPQVLFRTREVIDPDVLPEKVTVVAPALAERLAAAKARGFSHKWSPFDSAAINGDRLAVRSDWRQNLIRPDGGAKRGIGVDREGVAGGA